MLLGGFLRLWQLDKLPVSLFGDEIDVGVHAYSILKTGKDYYSNTFPIMFRSFAESRLPIPIYLAVPFIALFGLNEWGVRLGMAIMGIFGLVGFFLLCKELFGIRVGLIAVFLLSISPWHLQYSRQANDAGAVLTLTIFAVWLFLKGLKNYTLMLLSAVMFSLTFYSYSIAAIFTPLIGLSLLIIYREQIKKISRLRLFMVALVVLLLILPYIKFTFLGVSSERFSKISVEADQTLIDEITKRRVQSDSPLTPIFQNRLTVSANEIIKNYLKSYSTDFLFVNGDPNLRQSIGGFGELFLFNIPLLLFGFVVLVMTITKSPLNMGYLLIVVWLLIAPLPSALTRDGSFHASRLILLLPALLVICAWGLNYLFSNFKKNNFIKIVTLAIFLFGISNIFGYTYRYIVEWPHDSWRFWHSGFKETLTFVKTIDHQYSRVYFNNTYEPMLPRFLFWYSYDPALFQKQFQDDKHIEDIVPGFNGFKLGEKYYFVEIPKPYQKLINKDYLLVASARDDIPLPEMINSAEVKLLKTIYSPTNEPIFYVLSGQEVSEK